MLNEAWHFLFEGDASHFEALKPKNQCSSLDRNFSSGSEPMFYNLVQVLVDSLSESFSH